MYFAFGPKGPPSAVAVAGAEQRARHEDAAERDEEPSRCHVRLPARRSGELYSPGRGLSSKCARDFPLKHLAVDRNLRGFDQEAYLFAVVRGMRGRSWEFIGHEAVRGDASIGALTVVLALVGIGLAHIEFAAADQAIVTAGPLTNIAISSELNCAVNHVGDTEGEFFGDTACATEIRVGDTTYGPSSIPAGNRSGWVHAGQPVGGHRDRNRRRPVQDRHRG